jgi:hypothetical protein
MLNKNLEANADSAKNDKALDSDRDDPRVAKPLARCVRLSVRRPAASRQRGRAPARATREPRPSG